MCSRYVVCFSMYGVCMWCVYSVCCVLCTLFASVVNICGAVLGVCGVSIAVVLCVCGALPACGVSRWCMCSSLCVGSLVYVYVCLPVCCFFAQGILRVWGQCTVCFVCVCTHVRTCAVCFCVVLFQRPSPSPCVGLFHEFPDSPRWPRPGSQVGSQVPHGEPRIQGSTVNACKGKFLIRGES